MKSKKEATSSSTAGKEKANSQQLQADSHADQPSIMDSGIGHTIAYRMQDMMYDMDREPAYMNKIKMDRIILFDIKSIVFINFGPFQ